MPITKQEFESGKIHSTLEEEIYMFLNERKDRAFTSQEIMEGLNYRTEFSTPEISRISTFTIADFATFLYHLVEKEKIRMKIVRGRMYISAAAENPAKCPKCGGEIAKPKKTWKMTGRPNKKGESLQMQIGLYQCPRHGAFRVVMQKQRVPASAAYKAPRKRRAPRKRAVKKKPKSSAWTPI
jgi:hypothetical protein